MKRPHSLIIAGAALAAVAYLVLPGHATVATSAAAPSSLPKLTLAMDGHSITVGGATESGAVDIQSNVTAKHGAQPLLARLNPGVTADQAFAFATSKAGEDPNNASRVGSIVAAASAPKGTSD